MFVGLHLDGNTWTGAALDATGEPAPLLHPAPHDRALSPGPGLPRATARLLGERFQLRDGHGGPVERAVLAVPDEWLTTPDPDRPALAEQIEAEPIGSERLRAGQVETGQVGAGPPARTISRTLATAVALGHDHPGLSGRPLLLCELDRDGVRTSVCVPGPDGVRLLCHDRAVPAGGLDPDALIAQGLRRDGIRVGPAAVGRARERLGPAEAELWAARDADPELFGPEPYLRDTGLRVSLDQARQATADAAATVRSACAGALSRLSVLTPANDWHAVLLGPGYPPFRAAAAEGLGPLPLTVVPGADLPARGAALVAGGRADPGDRYPHELWLPVHRIEAGRLRDHEVRIAAAGELRAAGRTLSARGDHPGRAARVRLLAGRPLILLARSASASRRVRVPVPEEVTTALGEAVTPLTLRMTASGQVRVGVRVPPGRTVEWPAGPLPNLENCTGPEGEIS